MEPLFRELKNRGRTVRWETDKGGSPLEKKTAHPYYEKYFEGWTAREEVTASGRRRVRRVYTGPEFRPERQNRKLPALLLLLGADGLFVLSALACGRAGTKWYVYVPQVLSLLCLLFLQWYAVLMLTARPALTVREYREQALGYPRCACACALLLLLTAAGTLLCAVITGEGAAFGSAAAALGSAACAWGLARLELDSGYVRSEAGKEPRRLP